MANRIQQVYSLTEAVGAESGLNTFSVKLLKGKYSLVDICYCVHPAPNAHLIADIRWVTEFMNYANVVRIRATKYLLLESQRVYL